MLLCNRYPVLWVACVVWASALPAPCRSGQAAELPQRVPLGAGSYQRGFPAAADPLPVPYVGERWRGPIPSNDWSSSVVWSRFSEPMYAHPWTVRFFDRGIALHVPSVTAAAIGVFGSMPPVAACDLRIGTSCCEPFPDARLHAASDWFVTGVQRAGPTQLTASFGHGSPLVFVDCRNADLRLEFAEAPREWASGASWAAFSVRGRTYAVFWDAEIRRTVQNVPGEPTAWRFSKRPQTRTQRAERPSPERLGDARGSTGGGAGDAPSGHKPAGGEVPARRSTSDDAAIRLTVAALPERSESLLAAYRRAAVYRIADTRVDWSYDPPSRQVRAVYHCMLQPWLNGLRAGASSDVPPPAGKAAAATEGPMQTPATVVCLYPHQWRYLCPESEGARALNASFRTVRGPMKLYLGTRFTTLLRLSPVLPVLPPLPAVLKGAELSEAVEEVRRAADRDAALAANRPRLRDTYWDGKWMAALLDAAAALDGSERNGRAATVGQRSAAWRSLVRRRLEDWSTTDGTGAGDLHFTYHPRWGAAIGQPASYGSDRELNDHHFHYGYFIRSAAELARNDPQWARRWGPFVEWLIRDIAAPRRDDPQFPFLRCFDPYAGHSWASGHARFADGNNQESSSEAMNAWFGVLLWGEVTGNATWRDLGAFLYATEAAAIREYWYDAFGGNFPREFAFSVASMVWGGKSTHETWFSAEPEMIHGINWLPLHGGSLYLAVPRGLAAREFHALVREKGGTAWNAWEDLIAMYRALSDPEGARADWRARRAHVRGEAGNARTHTEYWLEFFRAVGAVEPDTWGEAPFSAVFRAGRQKTYCAYAPAGARHVRFSDGRVVDVGADRWAILRAAAD